MAATKVDVRPPSTFKDQLSSSYSDTSLSMSGLNAISSPELSARKFGGFTASPTHYKQTDFHRASHVVYKATSFLDSEGLGDDFDCSGVAANGSKPEQSNSKVGECCENGKRPNGTCGFSRGAVFGLFGTLSLHPSLLHLSPQGCGLTTIGLVNLHQFNHHPPLLFPVLHSNHRSHPPSITAEKDSLLVPTLSPFEVQCSPQSNENEGSDQKEQLGGQNLSSSLSENKPGCVNSSPPYSKSPLTSKEPSFEVTSVGVTDSDKAVSGDDEITDTIHEPLNQIHVTCEDAANKCCYEDVDGDHVPSLSDPDSFRQPPSSIKLDSNAPKVDHLTIKGHCELRKLPSDESGFFDTSSPSELASGGWWQGDCLRQSWDDQEEEEVDWDDEDCEGAVCEGEESADDLWKSFEDSMLSSQCLMIPSMKPQTPLTPPTPLIPLTPQTLASHESKTQDTYPSLVSLAKREYRRECEPCGDCVTTEQWCAGESKHDTSHVDTGSHCRDCTAGHTTTTNGMVSNRSMKRVHFPDNSKISVVHEIIAWNFAYRAARKGPWEQYARDRAHFRRRIDNLASVLEPCLLSKVASMAA